MVAAFRLIKRVSFFAIKPAADAADTFQSRCCLPFVQHAYGSSIFKPLGRINNAGLLRGMVEQCNTSLNLQLFPDEVTAVAAVLNRDHYKFK